MSAVGGATLGRQLLKFAYNVLDEDNETLVELKTAEAKMKETEACSLVKPLIYDIGMKVYVQSDVNQSIHACHVVEANESHIKIRYEDLRDLLGDGEEGKFDEWLLRSSRRWMPQVAAPSLGREIGGRTSHTSAEESKLLGVSVGYLRRHFLPEVEGIFDNTDQNYYDINPKLFYGPHGKGYGMQCPRDGKMHSSYVDGLSEEFQASLLAPPSPTKQRATFLLTWFWGLTATTVVSALVNHCHKEGLDPVSTFVWQCALCNNQYRIEATKARGLWEEFGPWSTMFDHRVRSIGRIVALISPWHAPEILTRVWCNFEIDIASNPENHIDFFVVLPDQDEKDFVQALSSSGMSVIYNSYQSVRIQNSTATAKDDVLNIMKRIDSSVEATAVEVPGGPRPCFRAGDEYQNSSACNAINARVTKVLQAWFIKAAKEYVREEIEKQTSNALKASTHLLHLVTQTSDWKAANEVFQTASKMAANIDATSTVDYADLSQSMGSCLRYQGNCAEAMAHYKEAERAFVAANATGTVHYAVLLQHMGVCLGTQGNHVRAMEQYEESQRVYATADATVTGSYAGLLKSMGVCLVAQGCYAEAMVRFKKSKWTFAAADASGTVAYANLLRNMGACLGKQGHCTEAIAQNEEAKEAFAAAGATATCWYAALLRNTGICFANQCRYDEASACYEEAKKIFAAADAVGTVGYADLLRNMGICLAKQGHCAEAMAHFKEAKAVFISAGATGTVQYTGLLKHMGACLRDQGHHAEAMACYKEVLYKLLCHHAEAMAAPSRRSNVTRPRGTRYLCCSGCIDGLTRLAFWRLREKVPPQGRVACAQLEANNGLGEPKTGKRSF